MLEIFTILLTLILISKFIEERTKISFVLIIIVLGYLTKDFFDLSILKDNFEEIIYLMLPIILIPDVLGLSSSELKENTSSIFFLAFSAVIISIFIAVGITHYIAFFDDIKAAYLILLFTPLMATDVVSVGAIFSKFRLPSKLKLYAEGESLFNDISAMIIFFFIAIPLADGNNIDVGSLITLTFKTVSISILIGGLFGLIGYFSFKNSHDNFNEIISTYLIAALSFLIAEKLELSGILAVVVAVIIFKYLFNKEGHYKKKNYAAALLHLNSKKIDSTISLRAYKKESQFLGFFANAVIFITIAAVIDIDLLWEYKTEIFYVFLLTTIIRYLVVMSFMKYKRSFPQRRREWCI